MLIIIIGISLRYQHRTAKLRQIVQQTKQKKKEKQKKNFDSYLLLKLNKMIKNGSSRVYFFIRTSNNSL